MGTSESVQGWIEKGSEKFKKDILQDLPPPAQPLALKILELVDDRKKVIGDLSAHGFATVVAYVGIGLDSQAQRVWLREVASHDEVQDALVNAARKAHKSYVDRQAQWKELRDLALEVIKAGGQFALPILLGLAKGG